MGSERFHSFRRPSSCTVLGNLSAYSAASVAVPVDVVVAVSCWVARFLCDECVFGCWRRSSPSDFDDVSSVLTMNPTGTKRPRSTLNRQRNRQTKTENRRRIEIIHV